MGRRQKLSCAQEQGPAERLPQVSQQLRNRMVYPKGHPSSQALTAALGSDSTKTTAPALATIIPHASAEQTSHKACPANNIAPAVQSAKQPECINGVPCADASNLHCNVVALMRLQCGFSIAMDAVIGIMLPAGGAQAACARQECIIFKIQHTARPSHPATAQPPHQPPGEQRSSATVLCQPLLLCALIPQILRLRHQAADWLSFNYSDRCGSITPCLCWQRWR